MRPWIAIPCAMLLALFVACNSSGEGGREIIIMQSENGCAPTSVDVTAGEKLKITAKNETGNSYEIEGVNGTQLEELLVPEGRSRSIGYTVPSEPGTHDVKCYQPGGASTIVKLVAGNGTDGTGRDTNTGPEPHAGNSDPADQAVDVQLIEYKVTPSLVSIAAGNIEFTARNSSKDQSHELAVLRVNDNGTLENMGEVEGIGAGNRGTIRLRLERGAYQLACLIIPGEAGSTVDHYAEGMHTEFTVK